MSAPHFWSGRTEMPPPRTAWIAWTADSSAWTVVIEGTPWRIAAVRIS